MKPHYLPRGYAPWRRTTGGSWVASTRVEGLTPGVFPPSTSRSISRRDADSTITGEKGGCAPDRLALVPVSGPTRESRSLSFFEAGMRTAIVRWPRVAAIGARIGKTTVNGAGQISKY